MFAELTWQLERLRNILHMLASESLPQKAHFLTGRFVLEDLAIQLPVFASSRSSWEPVTTRVEMEKQTEGGIILPQQTTLNHWWHHRRGLQ